MPQISEQTLVIAIQAVGWEVRSLRDTVAGGTACEDDGPLPEDWLRAAEAEMVVNLPPCREPVGD